MKKQELQKILKPLIKECIKEVIFEEGVLSGLIKEVAQGLGSQTIVESTAKPTTDFSRRRNLELEAETKSALLEKKRKLEESMGSQFEGIFENVSPITKGGSPSDSPSQSPLSGYSPDDAGVDISGIMAVATGGKPWKQIT